MGEAWFAFKKIMFKFETLDIWKKSVEFASFVYATTKNFPKEETYNLTSQLARAAVSISLNIAEGSSRKSKVDFKRFVQISLGSVYEVVTCLHIAKEQGYINQAIFDSAYLECESLSKMIHGFISYLER